MKKTLFIIILVVMASALDAQTYIWNVTKTIYRDGNGKSYNIDSLVSAMLFINNHIDTNVVYYSPGGATIWDDSVLQILVNKSQITHKKIHLSAGSYRFKTGVLCYLLNIGGTDFSQSWCNIEGNTPSEDVNDANATVINFNSYSGFAFAIQQGKNNVIENIILRGKYITPATGFYTNTFSQWWDSLSSISRTAPLAGIVIDPFSDPAYISNDTTKMYPNFHWGYISGMSQSGTTAAKISNCSFFGFPVGVLITAIAQLNGESCEVNDCNFGTTMSNVAATQAQAKDNWVHGGVWWGETHTDVDGVHWGLGHGDGSCSWNVDGVNIAGNNYEFANIVNKTMPAVFQNITAENVWMLGYCSKQSDVVAAQVSFSNCKFDLIHPQTPPYIWHGAGTSFTNCNIRYYDNTPSASQQRFVLNDVQDRILNCLFSAPPLVVYGGAYTPSTKQLGTIASAQSPFGSPIGTNNYDSIAGGSAVAVHLTGGNTGNFVTSDTSSLTFGTMLVTQGLDLVDTSHNIYVTGFNYNYLIPVGYVNHKVGTTVYFDYAGVNLIDGNTYQIYKCLYKNGAMP